ncbi:subunit NuA4 of histone acetyltransferase [Ordospora colligata]|nr:subunit NuA4 of histone acetyltransferase [Ordospora colligata]
MANGINTSTEKRKFRSLLAKKKRLKKEIFAIEKELFKTETAHLEMTQGAPITKNVDYYTSNRIDKKKSAVDDKMRMFNRNFPMPNK